MSNPPLPDGWVQQYDANYNRTFWVDTRVNPPRSIWVHPYEDEQFLAEYPEARSRKEALVLSGSDLDAPPSYDAAVGESSSASGSREKDRGTPLSESHEAVSGESSHADHKRGVFGRLKDKALGTKEEREEHKRIKSEQAAQAEERARKEREERKRIKAEQAARAEERARQIRLQEQREREERRRIRAEQMARAEERARQIRLRELEEREAYYQAYGGYAPYRQSYPPQPQRRGPFGSDDTVALMLGGLVGGLLLGDVIGGGF